MARGKKGAARTGTVYFDKRRQRWVAQLAPDPLTGKRPQRVAATQAEAVKLLRQMEAERAGGRDLSERNPTLAAFLTTWLDEVIKPNLKVTTYQSYRWVTGAYVVPTLGRLRLDKITPALGQRWVNELAGRVAPSTVRNAYLRLRAALDVAMDWYGLPRNPVARLQLPALLPSTAEAYMLKEARQLLAGAKGWRLEALIWVLLLLGLRKGEALGLAWRDLDWERATIAVTQQVQEIDGKVTISQGTKTEQSRRTLPIPPRLLELLRLHWANQKEERELRDVEWHEHGLIFANEAGGPLWPTNFNMAFERLCERALVRVLRVHDLRHTCATLLAEQGEPLETRAALLGHTATTITGHYTHATMTALRTAVERLERTLTSEGEAQAL